MEEGNPSLNIFLSKGISGLKPLDCNCDCYVCKSYSRAYIRYLTKVDEPVAYQLKSYHNLYWMQKFMQRIQKAISEDKLEELRDEIKIKFV